MCNRYHAEQPPGHIGADPLCYSCLRYATLPHVKDCPHLNTLGHKRPTAILEKGNSCDHFLSKLKEDL